MFHRDVALKVRNTVGAREGEEVVIGFQEQALVRGAMRVYGMPLGGLLLFSLLGEQLGGEGLALLGGVLGLGGGLLWAGRSKDLQGKEPVILSFKR